MIPLLMPPKWRVAPCGYTSANYGACFTDQSNMILVPSHFFTLLRKELCVRMLKAQFGPKNPFSTSVNIGIGVLHLFMP